LDAPSCIAARKGPGEGGRGRKLFQRKAGELSGKLEGGTIFKRKVTAQEKEGEEIALLLRASPNKKKEKRVG